MSPLIGSNKSGDQGLKQMAGTEVGQKTVLKKKKKRKKENGHLGAPVYGTFLGDTSGSHNLEKPNVWAIGVLYPLSAGQILQASQREGGADSGVRVLRA